MPTAIIKPVSFVAGTASSGVTLTENIYTKNGAGLQVQWVTGASGIKTADYNTDATTVLPVGAIISHWKLRYTAARTASVTNVYPYFRYNPSAGAITIADWVVTTGFTDYTYPDPGGAFPDGLPISSLNTPAAFAVARIGGNMSTSTGSTATLYLDYFEIEVTYTVPSADANIHLLMGDF